MAFYIIVHHPSDPNQLWANEWETQTLLRSITTPKMLPYGCQKLDKEVSVFSFTAAPGELSLRIYAAQHLFLKYTISIRRQPSVSSLMRRKLVRYRSPRRASGRVLMTLSCHPITLHICLLNVSSGS